MNTLPFPSSRDLQDAVYECIQHSAKSISNNEIEAFVIKKLQISEDVSNHIKSGNRTELQYRLAWVRTKLKSQGLIEKVEIARGHRYPNNPITNLINIAQ